MGQNGTFILGMGAQKSGTSWLYRYFATLEDFEQGMFKEYHVLDAIYAPGMDGRYNNSMKLAANVLATGREQRRDARKHVHRAVLTMEPEQYFEHFTRLLKVPGIRFTADLTPSHSALPMRALRKVIREFHARDISVKPVYLMRDPVERAWSALRMARRDKTLRKADFRAVGINDPYALSDEELLRMLPDMPGYLARANYRSVVEKLDTIFPSEDVTYAFYEDLFTERCVQRIARKIGFDYVTPDFGDIANASPKKRALSPDTMAYLRERYDGIYQYIGERFGPDRVAALWPNYQGI